MKRWVVVSCGLLAIAGFLALDSETTVAAKKPQIKVHECVYCAHGSAEDRARNDKPPGTPGNGPGGGGGGGGNKTPCSKTFAKWKNVTQLDVYIDGSGGPAAIPEDDFEDYVMLSFNEWACHSGIGEGITINYVGSAAGADITIGWGDLGSGGILGQAFTPTQGKTILFSEITMNSNQVAFNWVLGPVPAVDADGCAIEVGNGNTANSNYDFLSVMFHEIGHALGIDHSNRFCDPGSQCYDESMHPCTASEEWMRRAANPGDRAAVEKNYGPDGP